MREGIAFQAHSFMTEFVSINWADDFYRFEISSRKLLLPVTTGSRYSTLLFLKPIFPTFDVFYGFEQEKSELEEER